jgi:hypothetical protein
LEHDIQEIDRKIDTRVYRLYDLQPAEIALVEEQILPGSMHSALILPNLAFNLELSKSAL